MRPFLIFRTNNRLPSTSGQFIVSGQQFNMNFLLLCIQSSVCVACVYTVKKLGVISFRDFDTKDAKMWFPISCMLVGVIYTGSKSLVSMSPRMEGDCVLTVVLQTAILEYTCVYHLQEPHHYPHRA